MSRLMFGFNSWTYEVSLNGDNVIGVLKRGAALKIPGDSRCMQYLVFDSKGQLGNAAAIRDRSEGYGFHVTVCGFNPNDGKDPKHEHPRFSISDDAAERAAALDTGYALIANARAVAKDARKAHLGGPFYRMHGDLCPVDEAHYGLLVDFLADLAVRAREEGVELDPEYLNRFELSGPNNAKDMVRLAKDVKAAMHGTSPALPIRTEFDIYHSFLEGEDVEGVPKYLGSEGAIGSVHLGDTTRQALGTGALKDRIGEVLHVLHEAAKDGADVPVVPEIFCEPFRSSVNIFGWPSRGTEIPNPHDQAAASYTRINAIIGAYKAAGVNLLS